MIYTSRPVTYVIYTHAHSTHQEHVVRYVTKRRRLNPAFDHEPPSKIDGPDGRCSSLQTTSTPWRWRRRQALASTPGVPPRPCACRPYCQLAWDGAELIRMYGYIKDGMGWNGRQGEKTRRRPRVKSMDACS
jgi:hypothetical protein